MELPNVIELELKAKHFTDTEYFGCMCAVDKAFDEAYPDSRPGELGSVLYTNDGYYAHDSYTPGLFTADQLRASALPPETVIRTLTLTKK